MENTFTEILVGVTEAFWKLSATQASSVDANAMYGAVLDCMSFQRRTVQPCSLPCSLFHNPRSLEGLSTYDLCRSVQAKHDRPKTNLSLSSLSRHQKADLRNGFDVLLLGTVVSVCCNAFMSFTSLQEGFLHLQIRIKRLQMHWTQLFNNRLSTVPMCLFQQLLPWLAQPLQISPVHLVPFRILLVSGGNQLISRSFQRCFSNHLPGLNAFLQVSS